MTQLNVSPLPVADFTPAAVIDSADIGFVDDACVMQLAGGVDARAAKSPLRNSRQQADSLDYAGWFSPFDAAREMAFARG